MRLMDKPPTRWGDMPAACQAAISKKTDGAITSEDSWVKNECMLCPFCGGGDADHYISRCVCCWATTRAGQESLGAERAARRVRDAGIMHLHGIRESYDHPTVTHAAPRSATEHAIDYIFDSSVLLTNMDTWADPEDLDGGMVALALEEY